MRTLRPLLVLSSVALALGAAAAARAQDDPVVNHTRTSNRLEALPRLPVAQRKVTIYEFRSGVDGVDNRALTDMFMTALVKSGSFLVAERERLASDLATEKTLNAKGMTTGDTGQQKLRAADYIFEGAVSEANPNEDSSTKGVSIGGLETSRSRQAGKIAIDVRVIDANTGLVLDAVDVSKTVRSRGSSVAGVGALANSLAGLAGTSIPLSPDVQSSNEHHDGIDAAVRACIDAAVLELVQRYAR